MGSSGRWQAPIPKGIAGKTKGAVLATARRALFTVLAATHRDRHRPSCSIHRTRRYPPCFATARRALPTVLAATYGACHRPPSLSMTDIGHKRLSPCGEFFQADKRKWESSRTELDVSFYSCYKRTNIRF
jgi:hypothetical protein